MNEKQLIEKVIYTASLVSNRQDIDEKVDTISSITALGRPLQPQDMQAINEVQSYLEDYLVSKEQMRSFTKETLELQIEQHFNGSQANKSKILLISVISISVLVALLTTLLPAPSIQHKVQLAGATAFSLITLGAAIMFFNALGSFKSELRNAFFIICAGVAILGLSLLEQPFLEFFSLRQYPITSILYPIPILVGAILFYVGIKKYVQMLGVNNFWTSLWPLVIASLVLSIISILAPHLATNEPEVVHDAAAVIWACMLTLPCAAAIILKMSEKKLPDLYRQPIHILFLSMFPIIVVIMYQFVLRVIAGPFMQGIVAYVLFGFVFLMGLALLWAGYSFNKVSRY